MPADSKRLDYVPAFDGLRAVAVIPVVLSHFSDRARGGVVGVTIFFALSGFLITSLLLRELSDFGSISIKAFYMRRILRLYPALLACCIVSAVAGATIIRAPDGGDTTRAALPAAFYMTWWARVAGWKTGALVHTWTLSVEEHFYLLWPLTLLLTARRRVNLWVVAAGACVVSVAVWIARAATPSRSAGDVHAIAGMGFDAILIGCALAIVVHRGIVPHTANGQRAVRMVSLLAAALLGGLLLSGVALGPDATTAFLYRAADAVAACLTAVIVYQLVVAPTGSLTRVLESKPLVWIGKRSYGIYLWHVLIVFLPLHHVPIVRLVLIMALAYASFRWIESPFLRRKLRWRRLPDSFPHPSRTETAPAE